jgi:kynurenine formamidase
MRIIDLSLTVRAGMRGVDFETRTTIADQGYNTRILHLYSHATTHMDAPLHFVDGGRTTDQLALDKCVGPAWVASLGEVRPRALIDVPDLGSLADRIGSGDRLLLATGWSRRVDQPGYRDALPRVSLELARWLADRRIALLGVEPPSVADVNDREELIAVHRVLLEAGVVIVEGLARLDSLTREQVTFIALPLKIDGGDGTPVRAIAIEDAPETLAL